MTHDPMCPNIPERWDVEQSILWHAKCYCDVIARVREDERDKGDLGLIEWGAERGYDDGYAAALRDAIEAVKTHADETHNCVRGYGTGTCLPQHGDRCDITAALRVAAQKIEALGGKR